MKNRKATEERITEETKIKISISIDGSGKGKVETGIPFMDHMLKLFAKHGFFDLDVLAKGDLEIDGHHTMEDLGIVMGKVLKKALGDKARIRRYGCFSLPMDETLVNISLDLSGRPYLAYNVNYPATEVGGIGTRLFHEFFQALTVHLGLNLHIDLVRGEEVHHISEATFKCFGRALDQATSIDPRERGIPSTKGTLID